MGHDQNIRFGTMLVTFPRDDGGSHEEPDRTQFISDAAVTDWLQQRCLHLINIGRYQDADALQDEFDCPLHP